MQAIFSQEYLLYFKEKWRGTAGKDLLFGHIDGFQIDPKYFQKSACISVNAVIE